MLNEDVVILYLIFQQDTHCIDKICPCEFLKTLNLFIETWQYITNLFTTPPKWLPRGTV